MWIPGPTRAVLLSTVVIGLLVVFAVYATLQVSNDVRVVYEAEPYHPVVHGPVDLSFLPPLRPSSPMKEPPEEVVSAVVKHIGETERAFWNEREAFQKGKDWCEETRRFFTLGEGAGVLTYSFSLFMQERAPQGVYRHFIAARHFYGDTYEHEWKNPPTIPAPKRMDLLPPNLLHFAAKQKLWRVAFIHFFKNGDDMPLHALFNEWQNRAGELKRAYFRNDDSLRDDLPHNP